MPALEGPVEGPKQSIRDDEAHQRLLGRDPTHPLLFDGGLTCRGLLLSSPAPHKLVDSGLNMNDRKGPASSVLAEMFGNRPGWRLEPTSSPGSSIVWCFVFGGKIEFSVTADVDSIQLYEMETDREITFKDPEELATWLRTYRAEALQEPAIRGSWKSRFRNIFEWS